jgi:hypothetical protein
MIKNFMKALGILTLALMLGGAMTISAQADMTLDFLIPNTPSGAGTIVLGGGTITGSGIPVVSVSGTGTPFNADTILPLTNTFLNFQATIGGAVATDFITITSGAQTYMTGTFKDAPIVVPSSGKFRAFIADFDDTKPVSDVQAYFGFAPNMQWEGFINLSYNSLTGKALSGDVVNYTPIPGSLLLLGSGIIGLVGVGRRKKSV